MKENNKGLNWKINNSRKKIKNIAIKRIRTKMDKKLNEIKYWWMKLEKNKYKKRIKNSNKKMRTGLDKKICEIKCWWTKKINLKKH
jgi:hypothetical protein